MSMSVLPGGRSSDYVAHITSVVDKMALVYSRFHNLDRGEVKDAVLQRIKSTLSDRAAVTSAVARELRTLWSLDLVELHINLHPLDGFANEIYKQLKEMDSEHGMRKTGRGGCVENFFCSLAGLR